MNRPTPEPGVVLRVGLGEQPYLLTVQEVRPDSIHFATSWDTGAVRPAFNVDPVTTDLLKFNLTDATAEMKTDRWEDLLGAGYWMK